MNKTSIEEIHQDLINCFSEALEGKEFDLFHDNDDYNKEISALFDEFNSQIQEFNVIYRYIYILHKAIYLERKR